MLDLKGVEILGRKIFVSYKYADNSVKNLSLYKDSTVRDYVTEFEQMIDKTDHIYKGESDGEDLSKLNEETIWKKLRDRIYDSSLTIVFISPQMRDETKSDKEQWIPWEISYSLKEPSRKNKNGDNVESKTNAMLAVVLPDTNGEYSYYLEDKNCCSSLCVTHHTEKLFKIIKENKFNLNNPNKYTCKSGKVVWSGEVSYISAVKWCEFKSHYNDHINKAYERQNNIKDYTIKKDL